MRILPFVLCLVAAPAVAQDLNLLALNWARGQYASPLLCEVDGEPVRALRRVLIAPGPEGERVPVDRISFPDPDAEGATRCFSELGREEPLVAGWVHVTLPGRSRPDIARMDFQKALEREGGFTFDVLSSRLRLRGWKPGETEWREVDFRGGHASLSLVRPGTDGDKLLRDFRSPRKLRLELEAEDGTKLVFPLFQHAGR